MAFTHLLVLSLLAASSKAQQFPFTNTGAGLSPTSSFPSTFGQPNTGFGFQQSNTGFGFPQTSGQFSNLGFPTQSRLPGLPSTGLPGSNFPSFSSSTQRGTRLATVHATNKAGDHLYLTIEEQRDLGQRNPFGPSPFDGGQNPYGGESNSNLRVHGVFVKAGAQTGVISPDSLHGTFAMVVTRNGNIDGYCIATGEPYQVRSAATPYNPYGSFGGGNQFNPFSQFFPQQQQQGQSVLVSTPLHASTGTSTIEGQIRNVQLTQLYGRAIHVCADTQCKVRTDLCGTIRRDDKTVEEFKAYQQRHSTLAGAQGAGGVFGANGGGGTFGPAPGGTFGTVTPGAPFDLFAATGAGGATGTTGGTGSTPAGGGLF